MLETLISKGEQSDREKIRRFIAEKLGKPPEKIPEETQFSSLGIDSLSILDLQLYLEPEYEIEIPASRDFRTIGDIITYVIENSLRYKHNIY